MSFFSAFKKRGVINDKTNDKIEKLKKENEFIQIKTDEEICTLNTAYENYSNGGNILDCIKIYEQILISKTQWNSFNYCITLANLYFKANQKDKAWGFLNWMQINFGNDPYCAEYNMCKIRFSQFKILKSEKRYIDALLMLILSYVYKVYGADGRVYLNKDKLISEAKTTAKQIGMDDTELLNFVSEYECQLNKKHLDESDVREFYIEYINNNINHEV